jgi:phosphatidylserine synthase
MTPETLLLALIFTFILNIPFGYWRGRTRKFSLNWMLAIHLPVPIIFLVRVWVGAPLFLIPIFVLAFFLGQLSGSRIYKSRISEKGLYLDL